MFLQALLGNKLNQFNSDTSMNRIKTCLLDRDQASEYWIDQCKVDALVILDAGCGAGMSGGEVLRIKFNIWVLVSRRLFMSHTKVL